MWTAPDAVRFRCLGTGTLRCTFQLTMPTEPDVPWERDELILVLNLHRVSKGKPTAAQLTELSRDLRARRTQADGETPLAKVRSTSGVSAKVSAFEALRIKADAGRGGSELVTAVWAEFGRDGKRIWHEAKRVRGEWAASAPG